MKRSLLDRLRSNGAFYLGGALLLLLGIPLYQAVVLAPTGFGNALNTSGDGRFSAYLSWINGHIIQFLGYRALLMIAFALLLSLPFSLYRIIVAQEIMAQQEHEEATKAAEAVDEHEEKDEHEEEDAMPAYAWRGKGFAVLAVWFGLLGLSLYILGTLASTIYFSSVGSNFNAGSAPPENIASIVSFLAILTNTVGIGLLAVAVLFFGAMITRTGRNLWPGIWVAFGYTALAVTALLSGSAVAIATAPATGQSVLTSPATLLFALWALWFAIMLVRLKPEA